MNDVFKEYEMAVAFNALYRHFNRGTDENRGKLKITDLSAEIWTGDLTDTK